jgi:hypothetical protein
MRRQIKQPSFAELYAPKLITVLREGYSWVASKLMRASSHRALSRRGHNARFDISCLQIDA